MKITFRGATVPVFNLLGVKHDSENPADDFHGNVRDFVLQTDTFGYTGILLPDSNTEVLNPWFFASMVYNLSTRLIPFVAVNPIYAHPFFIAKYIVNISSQCKRPIFLNFITGTALFDAASLGDVKNHDAKYKRLEEYILLLNRLLLEPKMFSFGGSYYNLQNIALPETLEPKLAPVSYIAGNSPACLNVIRNTQASRLAMATTVEDLGNLTAERDYDLGFHFGIISRDSRDNALKVLQSFCPENDRDKKIKGFATTKSNIIWKRELLEKSKNNTGEDVYNLQPFANNCSDVPYLIGSYEATAAVIHSYLKNGLTLIVIEIPKTDFDEFYHINQVFQCLQIMINDEELVS
jgi:alkanesulfonate monooxygenase